MGRENRDYPNVPKRSLDAQHNEVLSVTKKLASFHVSENNFFQFFGSKTRLQICPLAVSETSNATDGTNRNLNIGETRAWRLDETGQIYSSEE